MCLKLALPRVFVCLKGRYNTDKTGKEMVTNVKMPSHFLAPGKLYQQVDSKTELSILFPSNLVFTTKPQL